jgi:hypothetical protein
MSASITAEVELLRVALGAFYEDTGFNLFAAAGTAQRDGRFGTPTQLMTNQMRADERLHHVCCDHWLVPFFEMAEASTRAKSAG